MVHRQPAKCRYDGHFKRSPALHALTPCCFSSYIIYQIDIFLDVFPRYTAIYANKFVYGAHYVSKNPKLAAVEQYISALSSHDMAVITDLYADDAVLEDGVQCAGGSRPLGVQGHALGLSFSCYDATVPSRRVLFRSRAG